MIAATRWSLVIQMLLLEYLRNVSRTNKRCVAGLRGPCNGADAHAAPPPSSTGARPPRVAPHESTTTTGSGAYASRRDTSHGACRPPSSTDHRCPAAQSGTARTDDHDQERERSVRIPSCHIARGLPAAPADRPTENATRARATSPPLHARHAPTLHTIDGRGLPLDFPAAHAPLPLPWFDRDTTINAHRSVTSVHAARSGPADTYVWLGGWMFAG
ncbi:hypothetical protein GUJ93_ZPchr0005g15285 [Zizania palustris]|uniref:Uncharacterized protein n=1 Tax=Zizania palustris TaxID=103762 RepID=A0A8J5SXC4_ZIZPA|nr:hypothetical protein GUJ93_ZPchr0005g15285 [Zizania palustris]